MPHPELTLAAEYEATKMGVLHPVYPSTEKLINKGVTQRIMKQMVYNLLQLTGNQFQENLPDYLLKELQLISRKDAIVNAHFPQSTGGLNPSPTPFKI